MRFEKFVALRGPNVWSRRPVVEAWVELGACAAWRLSDAPGLVERLVGWLPKLRQMPLGCEGAESMGLLPQKLSDSSTLAHVLTQTTLELQLLAGPGERFGETHAEPTPGRYRVVVACQEPSVSQACLEAAREIVLAAVEDRAIDVQTQMIHLRDLYYTQCLGPSTRAIVAAAHARGIPVRRLNRGSLVQLGHGIAQRRVWTAETDQTGALPEWISQDKDLTKRLLKIMGVPIPRGRPVSDPADAWKAACEIGPPVVVKPRNGNHGRGVFMNLRTQEEIEAVFPHAAKEGDGVLVERFIPGAEHRVLVVGKRVVAAARGEPAYVIGNSRQTIVELVTEQLDSDPRRGDDYSCPLSPIEYDATTLAVLERQGFTPQSVPPADCQVLIQVNGNLSIDVTDRVHPDVAARAVDAAQVVGLDVAGIDMVIEDIGRPMEEQRAAVVEVNAGPGLHIHLQPSEGKPRPVGEAIVDLLFPEDRSGRVPLVLVADSRGSSTARLVAQLLVEMHGHVGLAFRKGVFFNDRLIDPLPGTPMQAAHDVLINPDVEAAVIEATDESIRLEGLPAEDCHVAVLCRNAQDAAAVLIEAVLPGGTMVVNADDAAIADPARDKVEQVILCTSRPDHPRLIEHQALGGRAVFADEQSIVLAEGASGQRLRLTGLQADIDLIQAIAAAWALGMSGEAIERGLANIHSAEKLKRSSQLPSHAPA